MWAAAWPKLLAVGLALGIWQVVVWTGWRPTYALPPPATVFSTLVDDFGDIMQGALRTLRRGITGFAFALVIGSLIGLAVARSRVLRAGIGSMITGLQTMPSIAWFPLAILLFQLSEAAIFFVVVLGAAPSIANGLITGVDHIPPVLLRAGRSMGASRWATIRHIVLPASLPSYVAGLKQGWAFAWRSLLAGELLVIIPGALSLGQRLQSERELASADGVLAVMIVILVIGILIDSVFFATAERAIRRRWGLIDPGT